MTPRPGRAARASWHRRCPGSRRRRPASRRPVEPGTARIAVDLLGGDDAPAVVVDGALRACSADPDLHLLLVGPTEVADEVIAALDPADRARVTCCGRPRRRRHGRPTAARRRPADHRPGRRRAPSPTARADALVSAGATGATVTAAVLGLGRWPASADPRWPPSCPPSPGRSCCSTSAARLRAPPGRPGPARRARRRVRRGGAPASPRPGSGCSRSAPSPARATGCAGPPTPRCSPSAAARRRALRRPGRGPRRGRSAARADVVVTDGFTGNVLLKGIEGAYALAGGPPRQRSARPGRPRCSASPALWWSATAPPAATTSPPASLSPPTCVGGASPIRPRRSTATPRRVAPTAHRHRGTHMSNDKRRRPSDRPPGGRLRRRARARAAGAGADPPLVRVRERRAADQRAAGVPRRLGARRGDHHGAVPQPPGPARGAAGQAAGQRGQHARARRRGPRARPGRARRRTCCSARARRPPAAGTRRASSPTRWRRCSARSTSSTAWTPPARSIHRLFDPLMAESAGRGAALDWKTSLQELTAALRPRRAGVPDRGDRPGPRRRRSPPGWWWPATRYGGVRGAQQEGGRAAGRRGRLADARRADRPDRRRRQAIAGAGRATGPPGGRAGDGRQGQPIGRDDSVDRDEPFGPLERAERAAQAEQADHLAQAQPAGGADGHETGSGACLSCPRWRPSGRGWPSGSPAAGSPRSRCATRVRSAGTLPAACDFADVLAGRTVTGRAPARQVPVAAAGQR